MPRAVLITALSLLAGLWWYLEQPHTPRELFEARCSSCHDLPVRQLCGYEARLRPGIVDVMRRNQGADAEISPQEAVVLREFLREEFRCP